MPLQPQQRALAILGGVLGTGILIAFSAVTLLGGDDQKDSHISIGPDKSTTSTSSSVPPTTVTLPPSTLAPIPMVVPTPAPSPVPSGTIAVVPTTGAAPTTTAPPTPSTTKPPTVAAELAALLEQALLGGQAPPVDPLPRVDVEHQKDDLVRVTWALDDTLSESDQRYKAREEAFVLLRAIQGYDRLGDERIVLRATLPDPDTGEPLRVVRLAFDRSTLDAIDFDTLDPLSIFDVADDADIDPALAPTPPPTTSTSTSTSTSTTLP